MDERRVTFDVRRNVWSHASLVSRVQVVSGGSAFALLACLGLLEKRIIKLYHADFVSICQVGIDWPCSDRIDHTHCLADFESRLQRMGCAASIIALNPEHSYLLLAPIHASFGSAS
jgi:hypothetical protein